MVTSFIGRAPASESFGLVADWTQALNGKGDLGDILKRLMRLVKADVALIARVSLTDKTTKYVARCTLQDGGAWPQQPRTCARQLFGDWLATARNGSVWKLSDLSKDTAINPVSGALMVHVSEVAVCPLEKTTRRVDVLEFHFRQTPAQHDVDLLTMLASTLASCWHKRLSGLVSKTLARKRNFTCINASGESDVAILDIENPAQLSRSEFRVCTLLKDGMTVNVIAKALSVAPATVRTHLSSVFSKTSTCNQVELLHLLNRQTPQPEKLSARMR
ncbi:response regulator transcription factor [Roseovarius sp. B08]|uniref:response regulator transcription factor n=1 Tax=Roseovarius sp. B08 TaxID=3449223 RepID=UPI003EDB9438